MRALLADPSAPLSMRLGDIDKPHPSAGQAVVRAEHVALNHGDLNDATSGRIPPGSILGSDVAGIVIEPASDGSGPAAGTRVVGLGQGAFAEFVAVETSSLAVVPEAVDMAVAAALPVAGLAALISLRRCGSLLGKRVLVTGASGGVGTFAIQLAAAGGAHVTASVSSAGRGADLKALGAETVVVGLDDIDTQFDAVIECVGGAQLVRAWTLLAEGGDLQSVGWTSGEPAVFLPYSTIGPAKSITSHLTQGPVGTELEALLRSVESGVLSVRLGWRGSLANFAEATTALRERRIRGKAVLDVRG